MGPGGRGVVGRGTGEVTGLYLARVPDLEDAVAVAVIMSGELTA